MMKKMGLLIIGVGALIAIASIWYVAIQMLETPTGIELDDGYVSANDCNESYHYVCLDGLSNYSRNRVRELIDDGWIVSVSPGNKSDMITEIVSAYYWEI